MRVLLAGLLGGIAMYVWMTAAHTVLGLGETGMSQLPNDGPVLAAMQGSIGERDGFYYFPSAGNVPPDQQMAAMAARMKEAPSGILVYHPRGAEMNFARNLGLEFVNELAQALIAAFLVSLTALKTFVPRTGFVLGVGAVAALSGYASYWIWYGFPASMTGMGMGVTLAGYLAAGLVIAAVLGWKAKAKEAASAST